MRVSESPVEGEPVLIKWSLVVAPSPQANYMFVSWSQTTTRNALLIPTSASTSLSAPAIYWQQGAHRRKAAVGGRAIPGGDGRREEGAR